MVALSSSSKSFGSKLPSSVEGDVVAILKMQPCNYKDANRRINFTKRNDKPRCIKCCVAVCPDIAIEMELTVDDPPDEAHHE